MAASPNSSVAFRPATISKLAIFCLGDFDGATFGHPALPTPTLGSVSQNWIGTVAGRVGLVEDRWLVYGKFGGGWVQSDASHGARVVPDKFTSYHRGGFGRIFKMGDQPVSANIAAYYNAVHPTGTPNWQLRAELSLLYPER
jgi:hypothetical protein